MQLSLVFVLALLDIYCEAFEAGLRHRARNGAPNSQPLRLAAEPLAFHDAPPAPKPKCSEPHVADAYSDYNDRCPEECPLFAEVGKWGGPHQDTRFCTFQCVTGDQCGKGPFNKGKPIPSKELGICRIPDPGPGCRRWSLDGTDTCELCEYGYTLKPDGRCYLGPWAMIATIGVVSLLGIIVLFLVIYIFDLACRPVCNEEALQAGLEHREMMKVKKQLVRHAKNVESHVPTPTPQFGSGGPSRGRRSITSSFYDSRAKQGIEELVEAQVDYPLSTNLCKAEEVAGPGLTLHFTFQAGIMLWALFVALVWIVFALCINTDLLTIGQDGIGTPRHNCIVVAKGYQDQRESQWISVLYLSIVYVASFIGALVYSVVQLRKYQSADNSYKTMGDFAARLFGLPPLPGDQDVEIKLEQQLINQLGFDVVGVSIAWNYKQRADDVQEALHSLTASTSPRMDAPTDSQSPEGPRDFLRKPFKKFENFALHSTEKPADVKAEDVKEMLSNLKTSKNAFVVFHTEAERDLAFQKLKDGMKFEGSELVLEEIDCEPTTVAWVNFDGVSRLVRAARLLKGIGEILAGMAAWTLIFFGPYAWAIYTFNYDNGKTPGMTYSMAFSLVVVAGNQIMYFVCDRVADNMGFHFEDDKQAAYLVLYTFACMSNVILDFVVMYVITYKMVEGMNFRTHNGVHMHQVRMFPEGLDTYPMQLELAQNLFDYAMPSTFLIPFLLEPFLINIIPLTLTKLFVRSNKALTKQDAENALEPPPMELGRYGDILLNVFIFTLILGFPGSWAWQLALWMVISHLLIYMWDHYRVLRVMSNFTLSSMSVEWWSQVMLAPLIGIIAFMLVYKSLWHGYGNHDVFESSWSVAYACVGAFFAHTVLHLLLIVYVVPVFGNKHEDLHPEIKYEDLEQRVASNWFNSNPVQCLRSKFLLSNPKAEVEFKIAKGHAGVSKKDLASTSKVYGKSGA